MLQAQSAQLRASKADARWQKAQDTLAGTHFTCFTGTKVRLVLRASKADARWQKAQDTLAGTHFTCFACFTSTKVQLTQATLAEMTFCSLYLLYWYKSTNTDKAR